MQLGKIPEGQHHSIRSHYFVLYKDFAFEPQKRKRILTQPAERVVLMQM
jgi:hypothetical protein